MSGLASGAYLRFIDSNNKFIVGGYDDIAGNNQIYVYDSTTYALLTSFSTSFNNYDMITIMSVSRDGSTLAAISGNNLDPIQV